MSIRNVLLGVVLGVGTLAVVWYSGGRRWTEAYLEKMTEDWVSFQAPSNSQALEGITLSHDANTITVCNRGPDTVSDLLVRINDVYVAKGDSLEINKCETIPITTFRTSTWKKIPASTAMPLRKIEALGTISRRAYVSIDVQSAKDK